MHRFGSAWAKVSALVAGMVADADGIADMALLRHGRWSRSSPAVRPVDAGLLSAGVHLGHVRQPDAVATRLLEGLHEHTRCWPGSTAR